MPVPPEIIALVIVSLAGIAGFTISQIAKAIAGRGTSSSDLAQVKEQLNHYAAKLEDSQAALADQSRQIAELQERVDFAERLLAQARERSALGPGEKRG